MDARDSSLKTADPIDQCMAGYERELSCGHPDAAKQALLAALAERPEQDWLQCVRALVLHSHPGMAGTLLAAALKLYPDSVDLRFALAGLQQQGNQLVQAEASLREVLADQPDHVAATFLLAHVLEQQGRLQATAAAVHALFAYAPQDMATVIQAVELLDRCGRKQDAAAICEAEIAAGSTDARIHAYAGMLEIQLGEFDRARRNYSIALANSPQAIEWNIPLGLSRLQRYRDNSHPDFHLFRACLENPLLSEKVRATILFALGKAHDDIGDYAQATRYLRQANTMAHAATAWSRKHWRRATEARIARPPFSVALPAPGDWSPVFVVGVMRSGTTLVAELLSRHPDVCNRGELSCLPVLAQKLSGIPQGRIDAFAQASATYERQLRQDDSDAHWFIDKHPMNLMHIDLIMALWPNARIIHCRRNPRDIALSLWSQSFLDDAQGYAYDFTDIATVIKDCERVMAHWHKRHAQAIHTVSYEKLTADPAACMAELADWLGLPPCDLLSARSKSTMISTASLWQARQPVYTGSVERWRHYAPYLPELLRIPAN